MSGGDARSGCSVASQRPWKEPSETNPGRGAMAKEHTPSRGLLFLECAGEL